MAAPPPPPPPPPSTSTPNLSLSAPTGAGVALLDLERELTCSICTDILYQPLTCLDCLHTFCGSCLAEWFGWQHARAVAASRRDSHSGRERRGPVRVKVEYTCPSCRARVRETRPNATVTTLLDMWMAANPGRGKSEAEREEVKKVYVPGKTAVFPSAPASAEGTEAEGNDDDEDQRLVQEVREMSLREMQRGSFGAREQRGGSSGARRPVRARERGAHDVPNRGSRQQQHGQSRERDATSRDASRRRGADAERQIEHQSSLRSLLSTSDVDSSDMQEEILRQITEEGLLDGIDLDNIRVEQEDEISERIAQAYRRRQRELQSGRRRAASSQPAPRQLGDTASSNGQNSQSEQGRVRSRSNVDSRQTTNTVNGTETARNGQNLRPGGAREDTRRPVRTSTDLSQGRLRRRSQESRRSTDPPGGTRISEQWRRGAAGVSPQPPALSILDDEGERPAAPTQVVRTTALAAPSVTCNRCDRRHIEYDLHYTCGRCASGNDTYSLCRRCYIEGKGCLYWFGFGYTAWQKYERQAPTGGYPSGTDTPHILQARRYVKGAGPGAVLKTGVFCDLCHNNANSCYWHCAYCNDGEWGFCNSCVSQARHCTHPLLALALGNAASAPTQSGLPVDPASPLALTPLPISTSCNVCSYPIPPSHTHLHCPDCNEDDYDVCNACYAGFVASGRIASSDGPRGWRRCLVGHRMLVMGFVEDEHVQKLRRAVIEPVVGGWSLAPDIDRAAQLRAAKQVEGTTTASIRPPPVPSKVPSDTSTGTTTDEGATLLAAPPAQALPNNGLGTRVLALWTRVPDDGESASDELSFPRNAELTEVEDINGDWSCGVYCRRRGLFPGPYGRVLTT